MELQTIGQVSKLFNISIRTLHYYEQIGLLNPAKNDDNSYRLYDEKILIRLRQIIVLRKLRLSLKQIAEILDNNDTQVAVEAFELGLSEINNEITALSTIREVLAAFIKRLNIDGDKLALLEDENLLEIVDSLTISKINFKEQKVMENLNQADKELSKLTDNDVRIVYLPPATVASIHLIGNKPEDRASVILREFIMTTNLPCVKPDFRHYGFNHPNGTNDDDHGYEYWVTFPEGLELTPPVTKKHFEGGLYAAHTIVFGDFEKWNWLWSWVEGNDNFEFNLGDKECMDGLMEEHYNCFNQYNLKSFDKDKFQMDLMIPIKERE